MDDFAGWKDEFNEAMLCDYGIDLADIGMTDDELRRWADEPAYLAAARFAEKRGLDQKGAYR